MQRVQKKSVLFQDMVSARHPGHGTGYQYTVNRLGYKKIHKDQ
jgi:hypothetical protein